MILKAVAGLHRERRGLAARTNHGIGKFAILHFVAVRYDLFGNAHPRRVAQRIAEVIKFFLGKSRPAGA